MMIVVASSQNVSPSNIFFIELELLNVAFYCRMENSFEYLAYLSASIDQKRLKKCRVKSYHNEDTFPKPP